MAKSELKKSKKSVKPSKKEEKVSKQKKEESSSTEDSSSAEESSSSDDSSSDEEEEKKEEKKESSDSDSDSGSSSDEEEEKKEEKKESSDSDSDSSSDEEEEKKEEKKESSDSDSESSSEEEEKDSKKRKAEAEDTEEVTEAKKPKTDEEAEPATIFVGRLSWGVDDDQLKEAFNHIGGVIGARVLTERDTGRSRGYGYVDFETKEQAEKAISEMQGAEIDGRPVNLDMSTSKPRQQNTGERSNDRAKKFGDAPSEPSDTLFVGNLSFQTDRDSVQNFFSEYGTVLGVRLPTHPETEQPKGFGYVQFSSVDEAKSALEALNGEYLNDRAVRLDFSTPRPQNNGGGFDRSRSGTPSGGRGGRGGFRDGGRGGRGGRGGFRDGGRGGSRGGFGGRDRNSGSGSNSIPVQFKGNKKTFD